MAPRSTERAHKFRNKQRRLLFLGIARKCGDRHCVTVKKRSDHHHRKDQCIPATTYLEQQADVSALAWKDPLRASADYTILDLLKLREYMRRLVTNTLQQYLPRTADLAAKVKCMDVAEKLELVLFKMAISKEEYANESTLESRIASVINSRQLNYYSQRHAKSCSVGKMVSNAGGNPSTSSACASVGVRGPSSNTVAPIDHDFLKAREYMRTLVLSELNKRRPCPADDASKAKYLEFARRSEEILFQKANRKEAGAGGGEGSSRSIDHDTLRLRRYMQLLVFKVLVQKQPPPVDAASKAKYMDVARRLELRLFTMSTSKEEYMNPSTLSSRLESLIRSRDSNNQLTADSSPPGTTTTLAPEPEVPAETTMVKDQKVLESKDELEREIAENLKSMSLNR